MLRRTAQLVTPLVISAAVLTACGSSSSGGGGHTNDSSSAPATELSNAIQSLTSGPTLTTTLALDTTAANLVKITGEDGDEPLTARQAGLISGAHITIEVAAPSGKTVATGKTGNAFSLVGASGGTTYFSLRNVGDTMYAQIDFKDLLSDAGQSATYPDMQAHAAKLPGFVQALFDGKWVSISHDTISAIEGAVAGVTPGGLGSPSDLLKLANKLRADLLGDLTVTRNVIGDTDVLALSGNLKDLAKTFFHDLAVAVPSTKSLLHLVELSGIPNKILKATASVTGGALSRFEFDFGQFSPGQKDTLPVVATFAKLGPAITAPSGASVVNAGQLFQIFAQAATSRSSAVGTVTATTPTPVVTK